MRTAALPPSNSHAGRSPTPELGVLYPSELETGSGLRRLLQRTPIWCACSIEPPAGDHPGRSLAVVGCVARPRGSPGVVNKRLTA